MLNTEIIQDFNQFCNLKNEWNGLVDAAPQGTVFHRHEWLVAWWEIFSGGRNLFVALFRDSATDSLVGAFPGFLDNGRILLKSRTLRFMGSEKVSSDFLDILTWPGVEEAAIRSLAEVLEGRERKWKEIRLEDMDADSVLYRHFNRMPPGEYLAAEEPGDAQKCPVLRLPTSWEELLGKLSSKRRSKIRYYRRLLHRQGTVEIEKITEPADLESALEDVLRIRQQRLDAKGLSPVCPSAQYRRFHMRVCRDLFPHGIPQIRFLKLNGRRIAFAYQFCFKKKIFFYQTGFLDEYAKFSAGFVLLGALIENAIGDGMENFEFLRGEEDYKYQWGDVSDRNLVARSFYHRSLAGNLSRLGSRMEIQLKTVARKVVARNPRFIRGK